MSSSINLNQKNLKAIPKAVEQPNYDRKKVKTGIVHIGIGGFHRAHQAFYVDELLKKGVTDWGICGVALLEGDRKIYENLQQQDGLYTLMVHQENGKPSVRIIGSLVERLFAPDNPQQVIQKIADPAVKIVSLTITEGGYNFDSATGEFQTENPLVQWDLNHPEQPKTVFGYLAQALKRRQEIGAPLSILSCDNIQHNGDILKKMLLSYMDLALPGLRPWMEEKVSFPNSMVDRITPSTTPDDREELERIYGINDLWPVVSEEFRQWIITDDFAAGRPDWDRVGAQFVSDVSPYEMMKLRILNGGHTLTGLSGYLVGYDYIHEAIRDQTIREFFEVYMEKEVIPTLDPVEGIEVDEYTKTIIDRFSNPYIKDTVERIIGESSAKIPKFILASVIRNLREGRSVQGGGFIVAAWYQYLKKHIESQKTDRIRDAMAEELVKKVNQSQKEGNPQVFLQIETLFGTLRKEKRFVDSFLGSVAQLEEIGVQKTMENKFLSNK